MNDFNSPAIPVQTYSSIVTFWHAMNGLFLWEFVITLDYEWRVIRGRLPYQWTIWLYSFTRVATLVGVILCLVTLSVVAPISCQLWMSGPMSFSAVLINLSATTAMLLIVLRIIAIWNRNKVAVTLAIIAWLVSAAFHALSAARVCFTWVSAQCAPVKTESRLSSVLSFIPTMISETSDMVLLLIMLVGLLIVRRHGGSMFGLTRLLWKRGIIWFALATASEVLPLVLTVLNLNHRYILIFETHCLITMIIAAAQMHRSLVEFASGSCGEAHAGPQLSSLVLLRIKRTDNAATMPHRIEKAVDTTVEQQPTAEISDDDSSDISKAQASAHPLLSVSPSPIPLSQGV